MKRTRRGNAFTLIELLVVIGIIALLISILLPALAAARKSAQAVACMSNMRQWGMALQAYVDQSKGILPQKGPNGQSGASNVIGPNANGVIGLDDTSLWYNAFPPYMNQQSYSDMLLSYLQQGGDLPHVGGGASVWICPSAASPAALPPAAGINTGDVPWSGGNGFPTTPDIEFWELHGGFGATTVRVGNKNNLTIFPFFSSYAFNSKMGEVDVGGNSTVKTKINMSQLLPSDEVVVMGEKISIAADLLDPTVMAWYQTAQNNGGGFLLSNTGNSGLDPTYGYEKNISQPSIDWTRFAPRHKHGGHLLFADGHVQWFSWPDIQLPQSQWAGGNASANWNQPGKVIWSPLGPVQ